MGARVLIVDDEPQIRRFLGISLRAQGLEVAGAGISATLRDYVRFGLFMLHDGVIGNEILSGKIQDANTFALAETLRALGIELRRVVVVPDEIDLIAGEGVPGSGPRSGEGRYRSRSHVANSVPSSDQA